MKRISTQRKKYIETSLMAGRKVHLFEKECSAILIDGVIYVENGSNKRVMTWDTFLKIYLEGILPFEECGKEVR